MRLSRDDTTEELVIVVHETRLDAAVATRFKDSIRRLIGGGRMPVVIDMQAVDFLDSSGLGALIALRKSMAEGRPLILRGLTPRECHEVCVSGLAHAGFRYCHALKRSSNMIAN